MGSRHKQSDPPAYLTRGLTNVLQRTPSADEVAKFQRYLYLFLQWNSAHRLTAYRRPEEIVRHLLLDSLLFLQVLPPPALKLLDFGAGAGIPGIPLKIVLPRISLTLIEARRHRNSFLAAVLRALDLKGVRLIQERAERVLLEIPELQRAFDAVVLRAVGPLEAVIPVALHFVKPEGVCLASGPPAGQEPVLSFQNAQVNWRSVLSPIGNSPRQFLVVKKLR